jgi:hypothetical protein
MTTLLLEWTVNHGPGGSPAESPVDTAVLPQDEAGEDQGHNGSCKTLEQCTQGVEHSKKLNTGRSFKLIVR